MISYEAYKLLHLVSIFVFLSGAGIMLVSDAHKTRFWKMLTGFAGLFILVAGMGLLARLQRGFEPWVWGKIAVWVLLLGSGHFVAKRFPRYGMHAYVCTLVLAAAAAALAIYKPAL